MSDWRDWDDEMSAPLDDATADRLLAGQVPPDVPPAFVPLAVLIQAAQGPAGPGEYGDPHQIAVIADAIRIAPVHDAVPSRKRSMLTKLLTAKAALLAMTAVLGTTAAGAATGSLPDPAQSTVADALSHVGVSVPGPNKHANAKAKENAAKHAAAKAAKVKAGDDGTAEDPAGDPAKKTAPNPHAEYGLCNAFLAPPDTATSTDAAATTAESGKSHSTAFTRLMAAHGGTVESTTTFCQGVVAAKKATQGQSADKPDKPETPEKAEKPETPGKPDDAGKPAGTGKPENAGKPASAGSPADAGKPADDDDDDARPAAAGAPAKASHQP